MRNLRRRKNVYNDNISVHNMYLFIRSNCLDYLNIDFYVFLPVHRPVPSFIHPASQLHTLVVHVACAGQLPLVLTQSVFTPSACTVIEQI